jgi:hypothetical protein
MRLSVLIALLSVSVVLSLTVSVNAAHSPHAKLVSRRTSVVDRLRNQFIPTTGDRDTFTLAELQEFATLTQQWPEWLDRVGERVAHHTSKAYTRVSSAIQKGAAAVRETAGQVVESVKETVQEISQDVADNAKQVADWISDRFDDIVEAGWEAFVKLHGLTERVIKFIANRLYAITKTIREGKEAIIEMRRDRNDALKALVRDSSNAAKRAKFTDAEGKLKTAVTTFRLREWCTITYQRLVDHSEAVSRALLPSLFIEGVSGGASALVGGVERVTDLHTGSIVFFKYTGIRIGTGLVSLDASFYTGVGWKGTVSRLNTVDSYSGWFLGADAAAGVSIPPFSLSIGGLAAVSAGMTRPENGPNLKTFWSRFKTAMSEAAHAVKPEFSAVKTLAAAVGIGIGANLPIDFNADVSHTCYKHMDWMPNACAEKEAEFIKRLIIDPMWLMAVPTVPGGLGAAWQLLKLGLYTVHRSNNRFHSDHADWKQWECKALKPSEADCENQILHAAKIAHHEATLAAEELIDAERDQKHVTRKQESKTFLDKLEKDFIKGMGIKVDPDAKTKQQ